MWFGAHLPQLQFGTQRFDLETLLAYVRTARESGLSRLSANDHLIFSAPWLDGTTTLASVLPEAGDMQLMTTVALPGVRGPVPLAKTLAALDLLAGGRLTVGVGGGSSPDDYAAVGLPFEERWARLDEAVPLLRALWRGTAPPAGRRFYAAPDRRMLPLPAGGGGIPVWIGSWGSDAGLRRVARLGDGWLASAYNTTPEVFAAARHRLAELLASAGRDPAGFPNALATMWFHLTDDHADAERVWREHLLPVVRRPPEELHDRLPVGPPERFAELLSAFGDAGVQGVLVWPVTGQLDQLRRFATEVVPAVRAAGRPAG